MLKFNKIVLYLYHILVQNLNTSYVKVQLCASAWGQYPETDLNTSYVKVQLKSIRNSYIVRHI